MNLEWQSLKNMVNPVILETINILGYEKMTPVQVIYSFQTEISFRFPVFVFFLCKSVKIIVFRLPAFRQC